MDWTLLSLKGIIQINNLTSTFGIQNVTGASESNLNIRNKENINTSDSLAVIILQNVDISMCIMYYGSQ